MKRWPDPDHVGVCNNTTAICLVSAASFIVVLLARFLFRNPGHYLHSFVWLRKRDMQLKQGQY
jgi:hypothetical protein